MTVPDASDFDSTRLPGSATQPLEIAAIDSLLNRLLHAKIKLGLQRVKGLLASLNNPQAQVPTVHVAGSNGKGSVCAYLSSVLTQSGYRVGRYTSPHLVSWCERISINEDAIAPADLLRVLQQVMATFDPTAPDTPTQFEVLTVAAWLHFAQQAVDIAIVEVGLGGRLDATNVCDRPLVSVITSLSREHWQMLGPTLADIAREKAGILKPHRPAILAPQPAEAEAALKQSLNVLHCPATWVQPAIDLGDGWAEYRGLEPIHSTPISCKYPLPLIGPHQLINSAVAIATLQELRHQGWLIETEAIVDGMAQTRWPGRLQWLTWQGRSLLIDGAHNPAGAAMLRQYLDTSPRVQSPCSWVISMMATKDHADILRELLRAGDRLYLVPMPDDTPAADLLTLAQIAQAVCPDLAACQICSDVLAGLSAADQADPANTIVLCGSLYLIGNFFKLTQSFK